MNRKTIIFMGRSGCGKGTQVRKITDYLKKKDKRDIMHLEAGQHFRDFIQRDGYSSDLAKKIADEGGLQPVFLSVWAWASEFINKLTYDDHIFIDGSPRRKSEAIILESAFEFYNRKEVDIVYLNVSRNWAIERLKGRGRADDVEMSDILNRLDWFESDVVPALDFYRAHKSHNFHDINGEQDIDKVHQDIVESLDI